ncbi:MAG: hypothetical protein AAF221_03865 [Pseudomonadota bacterium]
MLILQAAARAKGPATVSLKTGFTDGLAPACRSYARHGYQDCPRNGLYVKDPNSCCMRKAL